MLSKITVRERGNTPRRFWKSWTAAVREGWRAAGELWHEQFRPKHFTHAGAREYGYLPRKGERGNEEGFRRSYTGRKLHKFGHTYPLVYTGESMRLTRMQDVRPTSKGVRVVYRAYKFNFRHPRSRIRMREEFTRISRREERDIRRAIDNRLQAEMNKARGGESVTVIK
jgi:hypothetical protein